jgi:long-chain acyl-CoA synthetase
MYARDYAAANPDQPVLIMATSGEQLTYKEYEERANRVAHFFRDIGLQPLDHVATFTENNLHLLEVEAGADRIGLYFTCINSYLSPEEVAYIVNDSTAKVFVTTRAKAEVARQLPALCPNVERWVMIDAVEPDGPFEPYEDLLAKYPRSYVENERLGAAMLYSSGTTGRPKGILRPLPEMSPGAVLPALTAVRYMFGFREGMHYLSPAPLYHSAPQASVSGAIRLGSTCVIMERFDPEQYLELVERYKITNSQLVPTMFSRMLKLPDDVRLKYDVSSLEKVVHAAAPCPVPVKEKMIEWWGPIINEYYGATEGHGFTFCTSEEWLEHKGSVGKPIVGELLILDDDGNVCPTGTPGTVWFKGATAFTYYNDPDKTAESRNAEGDTSSVGDVGYVDEDGYLYLTDRKTYMIISGGVNIYPQETENLLITHPKVMDAAVIGVPNDDLGEEVKAVVQLMDAVAPSPEVAQELIAFCGEHLARFKVPRTVDFEKELPRLPTGKLYKRLLRDRYWEGHGTSIL